MDFTKAEIITIGDEILYGQIVDTNSQWMADRLTQLGIKVVRILSIADTEFEITTALNEAMEKSDIVLLTGGLGPTNDDVTKKTLTHFTEDRLEVHPVAENHVKSIFEKRGLPFTDTNRQQAFIPSKCTYLHNASGTAPGMWFDYKGKTIVSMAGVPHEMKYLMENEVLPRIKTKYLSTEISHRYVKTFGIGESFLADKIKDWEDSLPKNIKLAYLPSTGEVMLRLTAFGQNTDGELKEKLDELKIIINDRVYAWEELTLEEKIGELLLKANATLSTAESCTGGNIAHLITKVAGSSAYFLGSVVSYANSAKLDILKVKSETLSNFGAVSEQTVIEMALGVQKLTHSTFAVSTSGIAGPGGGTPEKPVGTVWIAVTDGVTTVTRKLQLGKDRVSNIIYASKAALNLLRTEFLI